MNIIQMIWDSLFGCRNYRVVYPDGSRTVLLKLSQAESLQETFGGEIIYETTRD